MELSPRLAAIAGRVPPGSRLADIGTDHAYLPAYLILEGTISSAVASDVNRGPLDRGRETARLAGVEEKIDFRLSDGLKGLGEDEADVIVIAGMGGYLIRDILAEDPAKTVSFSKFILQPRNNAGILRHWLVTNRFRIGRNQLVREGKFICEIITVFPPNSSDTGDMSLSEPLPGETDPSWDLPRVLCETQPELAAEYARVKLGIEEKILEGMQRSDSVAPPLLAVVKERIAYFQKYARDASTDIPPDVLATGDF